MTTLMVSRRQLLPRAASFLRVIQSFWFPLLLSFLMLSLAVLLFIMNPLLSPLGVFPAVILLLDARARYLSFRYYSKETRVVNSLRILTNCRKSFCSRQVAIALYGNVGRKFYRNYGYRWFHILPDDTFSKKSPFLTTSFWKSVVIPVRS